MNFGLDLENLCIADGDFLSPDDYILITDQGKIYRNTKEILHSIKFSEHLFPRIRIITENRFIVTDGELLTGEDNAWIFDESGKIEKSFYIGSALKMLVTKTRIIVSYSDAQLDSNWKHATNALVIFDYEGNSLFEYYRDMKEEDRVAILENYALLKKDENTIYFMPICFSSTHSFPIVELSLIDYSQKVLFYLIDEDRKEKFIPEKFYNPSAFTKKGDKWYFLSRDTGDPEHKNLRSVIFEMDSNRHIREIGECAFSVRMRGLPNGKFSVPAGVYPPYNHSSSFIEF